MKRIFVKVLAGVVIVSGATFADIAIVQGQERTLPKASGQKASFDIVQRSLDKRVSVDFNKTSLTDVCEYLTKTSGLQVTCDEGLKDKTLTLTVTNMTLRNVILWTCRLKDVSVTQTTKGLRFTQDPNVKAFDLTKRMGINFDKTPLAVCCEKVASFFSVKITFDLELAKRPISLVLKHGSLEQILRLVAKQSKAVVRKGNGVNAYRLDSKIKIEKKRKAFLKRLEKRYTVKFKNTPIEDVILHLRTITNTNFMYKANGKKMPTINLTAKDMPLKNILTWITSMSNLRWEIKDDVILITPKEKDKSKKSRTKKESGVF